VVERAMVGAGSPWLCPLCRVEGLQLKPCPKLKVSGWYIHQGGLRNSGHA